MEPNILRSCCTLGVLLTCWLLSGCGGGVEDRLDISGDATFDGKPIVYGSVSIIPDTAAGQEGPTGVAQIKDGKYDTSQEGSQGILPGKYILRVTAYPSELPEQPDETVEVATVKPLFVNWEIKTELTEGKFDIVVPAEAEGFAPQGQRPPVRGGNEP